MTHPMQMNCPHSEDSICLNCSTEYYTSHVVPLEEYKMMMGCCLDLIKETIEQLGEPMDATPPMSYNDAIANLCAKKNRELWIHKRVIEKLRDVLLGQNVPARELIGDFVLQAQKELEEEMKK